jgi:hypothetical protein
MHGSILPVMFSVRIFFYEWKPVEIVPFSSNSQVIHRTIETIHNLHGSFSHLEGTIPRWPKQPLVVWMMCQDDALLVRALLLGSRTF